MYQPLCPERHGPWSVAQAWSAGRRGRQGCCPGRRRGHQARTERPAPPWLFVYLLDLGAREGNILLMCGLAFITLVKPNLVPVTLMLAMHVHARHGTRTFLISIRSFVVSCGLLFLFSSHFFSSWTIWLDWYNFLIGSDNTKLFYPVSQGNYAPVLLLAEHLNISKSMATASFSGA